MFENGQNICTTAVTWEVAPWLLLTPSKWGDGKNVTRQSHRLLPLCPSIHWHWQPGLNCLKQLHGWHGLPESSHHGAGLESQNMVAQESPSDHLLWICLVEHVLQIILLLLIYRNKCNRAQRSRNNASLKSMKAVAHNTEDTASWCCITACLCTKQH